MGNDKKKQKFKEGAIVKIKLSNNQVVFGRLLPGFHVGIYDWVVKQDENIPDIASITVHSIFLYVRIFKDVVVKGIFEIIGFKELSSSDINDMPPHFKQNQSNFEECKIYYEDGKEIKATPQECLGLEGPIVWDAASLVNRIQNYYQGKKNPYVELNKVILSESDPRYLTPPKALRWDFEMQEFYRVDK
ncbi:MAG: Imm26 family immunity protein [Flavisolibacter sp.]